MARQLEQGAGIGFDLSVPGKLRIYTVGENTSVDDVARTTAQNALSAATAAQTEVDALESTVAGLNPFPPGGTDGQALTRTPDGYTWTTITAGTGPAGQDGIPGSQWLFGTTAPAAILGINGDWYVDTATYNIYRKENGAYVLRGNIRGVKGDKGDTGSQGIQGIQGPKGSTDVSISFNANGSAYYQAPVACVMGVPVTRGTGTFAYAYSTDGISFAAATFPLNMAANSVLRVTVSAIGTYASAGFVRS